MIVLDASALLNLLVRSKDDDALRDRVLDAAELHAPHLVDIEVASGLRRLAAAGRLSADRATEACRDAALLLILRYPHVPLIERAWELRANASISDGVYIALAEMLGVPLVTCDRRLANVPGHGAVVEVFA